MIFARPYVWARIAFTLSFFGSNTSTASTISWPASIQAADEAVLFDVAANLAAGGVPASVTPSGFTQVGTSQTSVSGGVVAARFNMWRKTLVGGETSLTGMSGTFGTQKILFVFRPNAAGGTWTSSSVNAYLDTANPPAGSQTVNVTTAPGLVLAFSSDLTSAGHLTMSPAGTNVDGSLGTGGYIVYNSSPATNTVSTNYTGGVAMGSFYLSLF